MAGSFLRCVYAQQKFANIKLRREDPKQTKKNTTKCPRISSKTSYNNNNPKRAEENQGRTEENRGRTEEEARRSEEKRGEPWRRRLAAVVATFKVVVENNLCSARALYRIESEL